LIEVENHQNGFELRLKMLGLIYRFSKHFYELGCRNSIKIVLKINLNLNEERVREHNLVLLVTEHMIGKVTEYVYDKQFSDTKNCRIEFWFHYYTFQMSLNIL